MTDLFAFGFLAFLAGAAFGIIWRTIADVGHDREIEAVLDEQEARHDRAIARKDEEIKKLRAALNGARMAKITRRQA